MEIEDDFRKYASKQMESFHNMQFPELPGYHYAAWVQECHAKMCAYMKNVASIQVFINILLSIHCFKQF